MSNLGKLALLSMAAMLGGALTAQAAPLVTLSAGLSTYNPYASGFSPCPEGNPNGGPDCAKLIPPSVPPRF